MHEHEHFPEEEDDSDLYKRIDPSNLYYEFNLMKCYKLCNLRWILFFSLALHFVANSNLLYNIIESFHKCSSKSNSFSLNNFLFFSFDFNFQPIEIAAAEANIICCCILFFRANSIKYVLWHFN